ncbi:MAG TPA: MCE family protein, partial [Nocardioides sp.]
MRDRLSALKRPLPKPTLPKPTLPRVTLPRVAVAVVLVTLIAALAWWRTSTDEPILITADFKDTTGLYVGNEVVYLGVPIGEVTSIEPAGTTMEVTLEIDPDSELPAETGATMLQSSLVTDRYIELGPAYTGGPQLASGAHIEATHTRSPANMDQVVASIDDLVNALNSTTPGGKDVGHLLSVAARTMDGNGARTRDAMVAGEKALRTINNNGDDLTRVTSNLATLTEAIKARDKTIRAFSSDVSTTSTVVAKQRKSITSTIRALYALTSVVDTFVAKNRKVIGK